LLRSLGLGKYEAAFRENEIDQNGPPEPEGSKERATGISRQQRKGREGDSMNHEIHNVGAAEKIGRYSDAIEVAPGLRWLHTNDPHRSLQQ
jgi:hypothetical protein